MAGTATSVSPIFEVIFEKQMDQQTRSLYPHGINFKNAPRPFYGHYPFKAVVQTGSYQTQEEINRRNKLEKKIDAYLYEYPGGVASYVMKGVNVFFKTEPDLRSFCNVFGDLVKTVFFMPPEELNLVIENVGSSIRDGLYWGRYRYRIVFRYLDLKEEDELDDWITSFFGSNETDSDRFHYAYNKARCLYLDHEADVMATKIAMAHFINDINKIILRSEISKHEDVSSQDVDREEYRAHGNGDRGTRAGA